jgi:hypothetical protein
MNRLIVFLIPIFILASMGSSEFKGFKSKEEAQKELERMYPQEEETGDAGPHNDEFTSIRKFVQYIFKHPDEQVIIIYGARSQRDAAEALRSFLGRGRGYSVTEASTKKSNVVLRIARAVNLAQLSQSKSFILGSGLDNPLIKRMEDRKKIGISGNKAQFRLFAKPNCLAIACRTNKMFVELVRVFIRSHDDFDESVYSYFYMN